MSLTPIGSRLTASLADEYTRMQNQWFFKWHHIGGPMIEIESFREKPIRYGGIKFAGSAHAVYWDTIRLYLRKKIGTIFDDVEHELERYTLEIRDKALTEAEGIVISFAAKIRAAAVEKDRVLRGDGVRFPSPQNIGGWPSAGDADIRARVAELRRIYCDLRVELGGGEVMFSSLTNDRVTLVKKDGTVVRENIPATVSSKQITTFMPDLPIEVGDHFLRQLPSKLVEDYIVTDPAFRSGVAPIPPHFQTKVRRTDAPLAPPQTIIATFHGANSRMNLNSTDNSVNIASGISVDQLTSFVAQVRSSMPALPTEQQQAIGEPLAVLEAEIANPAPSQSKIRATLGSMKTIAEGAAGNLVATGISALIAQILGGS
jgi:hypothetical protein